MTYRYDCGTLCGWLSQYDVQYDYDDERYDRHDLIGSEATHSVDDATDDLGCLMPHPHDATDADGERESRAMMRRMTLSLLVIGGRGGSVSSEMLGSMKVMLVCPVRDEVGDTEQCPASPHEGDGRCRGDGACCLHGFLQLVLTSYH